MFIKRLRSSTHNKKELHKSEEREKNWDQRFFLYKIPPYDAFKDANYLSLGLMKSKIKYERFLEKEKQRKLKGKNTFYSEHYIIDSQKGNKTTKSKSKKKLFSAINLKNDEIDNKNNFAKTYSFKYNKTKSSLDEKGNNNLTGEELDLLDEFDIIKVMWNKLGVTKNYQKSFVEFINTLDNADNIRTFLNLEKIQMQKFKYELTQLLKKIIHRNDKISYLKQLINVYEDILKEKKNNPEKNNSNLDSLSNINEKQIISDIHSCLLSLRISTINVVNQIKNFSMTNSYFLYMNKIDLEKLRNDYYYNYEYLLSIKTDLDFIQNTVLTNLYDFENYDGCDPFFISFSKLKEEGEENNEDKEKKNTGRKLDISKKMLEEIQNCIYFLQQAELLDKCKYSNKERKHKNRVLQFLKRGNNYNENKKKSYGIGNLFKGNLEQDIVKLKTRKEYERIFNFIKTNNADLKDKNKLKKSSKKKNDIHLMTSQELKKKFSQYDLLNELINEPKNDEQKEEEFKSKDKVINILNFQKDEEEKKEESEHNKYDNDFNELEENLNKKDETENDNKQEKNDENKFKEEKEEVKQNESKENNEELEKNDENSEKEENKNEEIKDDKKQNDLKIEEEIDDVLLKESKVDNGPQKEEKIPNYISSFFTESIDKLTLLYNDYLSTNPNIYTTFTPNNSKDFIFGIYPKIIIAKNDQENEDKIYGLSGINYYINEDKEFILKINHLSVNDNNKDILNKIIDLIERDIKYKIIEIDLIKDNNILLEVLQNKGFKEYINNDEKIVMRKENINDEENIKICSQINYDSLAVLSLINKEIKETQNTKYTCFNGVINPINLSLLIDKLKINDKYKVEILSQNQTTSLLETLSKQENKFFDFFKTQNNECNNISEITNNEIAPKEGFYYSILNNQLQIQIKTLMTLKMENYLYNGIEINTKNNIIKENKYNSDLYCLPTLNQNIFILLYPFNEKFKNDLSKHNTNVYDLFNSSFKIYIKNYLSTNNTDNDSNNKRFLWIPAFNINSNLFTSDDGMNNYIKIKSNEDIDFKIEEYNEFLKFNYLPDRNKDKNMDINITNSDNDIIIKDKFIIGICHKEFMESFDIPIISLVNVSKDNFVKDK